MEPRRLLQPVSIRAVTNSLQNLFCSSSLLTCFFIKLLLQLPFYWPDLLPPGWPWTDLSSSSSDIVQQVKHDDKSNHKNLKPLWNTVFSLSLPHPGTILFMGQINKPWNLHQCSLPDHKAGTILLRHAWIQTHTHNLAVLMYRAVVYLFKEKCFFWLFFLYCITNLQIKLSCCFNFYSLFWIYCIFRRLWMSFVYFAGSGVSSSVCLLWFQFELSGCFTLAWSFIPNYWCMPHME